MTSELPYAAGEMTLPPRSLIYYFPDLLLSHVRQCYLGLTCLCVSGRRRSCTQLYGIQCINQGSPTKGVL